MKTLIKLVTKEQSDLGLLYFCIDVRKLRIFTVDTVVVLHLDSSMGLVNFNIDNNSYTNTFTIYVLQGKGSHF